jgi:1,2-diacylglycerol 3-alpha-glucosyltransferase
VDGQPWRAVPDDVVLRCGLALGHELDRPLLRLLRNELRRAEALGIAGRALRRRDLSRRRLAERLERAGVSPAAEQQALDSLVAAGAVDDARLAGTRAAAFAERGWGNAAIRERLLAEGIGPGEAEAALLGLAPETDRAAALAARAGEARNAWMLLARRGFEADAIDAVLGPLDEGDVGGLG